MFWQSNAESYTADVTFAFKIQNKYHKAKWSNYLKYLRIHKQGKISLKTNDTNERSQSFINCLHYKTFWTLKNIQGSAYQRYRISETAMLLSPQFKPILLEVNWKLCPGIQPSITTWRTKNPQRERLWKRSKHYIRVASYFQHYLLFKRRLNSNLFMESQAMASFLGTCWS